MREARVCYDHLAGDHAVAMLDRFLDRRIIVARADTIALGPDSRRFFEAVGIDIADIATARRPACRACLDWSVRRSHLAGALGAKILDHIVERKWARRSPESRVVTFTPPGRRAFEKTFLA